jgi:hypothetical protein
MLRRTQTSNMPALGISFIDIIVRLRCNVGDWDAYMMSKYARADQSSDGCNPLVLGYVRQEKALR